MEASKQEAVESENKMKFRRICVFCGSRSGNRTSFSDATLDLGKQLVSNLGDKYESKLPTELSYMNEKTPLFSLTPMLGSLLLQFFWVEDQNNVIWP